MALRVNTGDEGRTMVLEGDATIESVARLRQALLDMLEQGRGLAVDVRGVQRADLTFLQLLCAANRTASERGGALVVHGTWSPEVARLIREAGFERTADGLFARAF